MPVINICKIQFCPNCRILNYELLRYSHISNSTNLRLIVPFIICLTSLRFLPPLSLFLSFLIYCHSQISNSTSTQIQNSVCHCHLQYYFPYSLLSSPSLTDICNATSMQNSNFWQLLTSIRILFHLFFYLLHSFSHIFNYHIFTSVQIQNPTCS